jgi:hypothetical protein
MATLFTVSANVWRLAWAIRGLMTYELTNSANSGELTLNSRV